MNENDKNLPSINDFLKNSDLPSINDFLNGDSDLPSIKSYVQEEITDEVLSEEVLEEVEVEETSEGRDLTEVLRLINDVRDSIPDIPEIKYYDNELQQLTEYIKSVRDEIPEIPEIRYYENDIHRLDEQIEEVRNAIPVFPKWINEVNEVPDFSWIGKTFSVIDDDLVKVNDNIDLVKDSLDREVESILETINVRSFETKVDINGLKETFKTTKERIYQELKESATKIWEVRKQYKDDQKSLKEEVKKEYFVLEQNLSERLEEFNVVIEENKDLFTEYFNSLKESLKEDINNLPEVKYYDEEINQVKVDIQDLYSLVKTIKEEQVSLQEGLLNEPPDKPESVDGQRDPLTPLDRNFATLEDLAGHYRLFINRIQQQISTIGGGGAGFIKDLGDVVFDEPTGSGKLLVYDGSNWVGVASTSIGNIGIQSAGTLIGSGVKTLNFIGLGNTFSVNGDVIDISISGNTGAGGTWAATTAGIHTTKNVGIATTSAKTDVSLYVVGDVEITGNISVAGTITYDDVTNVDSIGIVTARSGIKVLSGGIDAVGVVTATSFVGDGSALTGIAATDIINTQSINVSGFSTFTNIFHTGIATFGASNGIGTVTVGLGSTALFVDGNARVTGILTVGKASVIIDGDNNTITTGNVTINNSTITLGDNVTLSASATGINSAPNVLYVAKDGNDSNNGTSIDNAKLTIAGAVGIATDGTVIKVLAGNYTENNPIEVPPFVSIVGDDLKTVTVTPNIASKDIFHVRKGCYLTNMTFTNHVYPSAAVGFPTSEIATNVGGGKWESPYVQNCTSNTTTGTGLRVDGAQAEGLKSIVCDSYTQYNQGGVGVAITNEGFAQLVSVFTICCNEAISCHKGGQADLTNSNSSFGTYGLVADGVSDVQFTGIVTSSAAAAQDTVTVAISTTTRPYDGQLVYFGTLYQSVQTITVSAGGTGYTSTPTVTIDAPTGPNGESATAFATLDGESVSSITIISSGSQYETTPNVTISSPNVGVNTATATITMSPIYYTINRSTPVVAGITTLTLDENLLNTVGVGSTAYFHQVSRIVASSHTFEYVGSGNDITSATPKRGGVTVQENEVVTINGGRVVYTSTDQAGNFRIGDGLQINQNTGTISGRAFTRSLFSEMTPFILALS